jgi:transposase-like protein
LPALFNSRFHCMSCGRNESLDVGSSFYFFA